MIIIVRKHNLILVALVLMLSVAILSLNTLGNSAAPVTGAPGAQKTVLLDPGHGGEDPGVDHRQANSRWSARSTAEP